MTDISAMMMNLDLMQSAISSVRQQPVSRVEQSADVQPAVESKEQGVYAVKGDSLYKEEMDVNTDGVVTNAEMAQYYAKIASDYGSNMPTLANKTDNVVTTAQAANAYMANESAYSAAYTSLIEASA